MEAHPWMLKCRKTLRQMNESPEKVAEEQELRTSLPNDGVVQSKSR